MKNKGYVDNDVDSIDTLKNKRMRTIKMSEEDFETNDSLSDTDFSGVDIDGKLRLLETFCALVMRKMQKNY